MFVIFFSGMRVAFNDGRVPYGGRQQTSPHGSPQPMPSPGNQANEMAVSRHCERPY